MNVAIGELVKKHRARAGLDTHTVADSFGLSPAYVRAIEAGQRALPAYAVVGLVEQFGMAWSAASSLVAVAGFLDLARDDNEYPPDKLLELARRLRDRHAEYRVFLDDLEEIVVSKVRPPAKGTKPAEQSSEWDARTLMLSSILETCVNQQTGADRRRGVRTPASLSPVFEDLVERLADQLAMFPPHVNADSIKKFERTHSGRIRSLLGYVSGPDSLTGSSADDWQVVRGALSPTVHVLVSLEPELDIDELENRFKEILLKAGPANARLQSELSDRIRVQSAGAFKDDCHKALLFDFTKRSRATAGAPSSDALRRFPNAWLYELQPESQDSHVPRWVGFLMDKDPVRGYAVAMNGDHVQEWLAIFRKAWPQGEVRRAARARKRPTIRKRT